MSMFQRALERLRELVFPDAPELIVQPTWMKAYADMRGRYNRYEYYYSGRIFREYADPKLPPEEQELKYPLKMNLTREWADMMAGYLWGQWNDQVVGFSVERRKQESGSIAEAEERRCQAMEDVLRNQWLLNGNDAHADGAATDTMVYGGTVLKTYWDNTEREPGRRLKDEWIAPDIFLPRWHPMDVNRLIEVIVAYTISRQDAKDIFNLSEIQVASIPEDPIVWEKWTDQRFILKVEDITIEDKKNPVGWIPYTYIPRRRSKADLYGYYGLSTLEDTMAMQDEVNARAADIGDGVAYSSHPIRVVVHYTGTEDLEVGPDALWNLGFGFGGREPKAYTLDTKTNYKEAMEYVSQVEHMGRSAAHLPSIAFGEDEGSQRSGTTLLIRFLPLTQEIRRTRLYWDDGLRRKAMSTLRLAARHMEEVGYELKDVDDRIIGVDFAPILPKDVSEKINEWAIRIEGGFGTPEEAYRDIGHSQPKEAAEQALEYQRQVARVENITKGVQSVAGTAGAAGKATGGPKAKNKSGKNSKGTQKAAGSAKKAGEKD